jgi:hypothetical protein
LISTSIRGIRGTQCELDVTGWIAGGYELDYIPQISVQEFAELLPVPPAELFSQSESWLDRSLLCQ